MRFGKKKKDKGKKPVINKVARPGAKPVDGATLKPGTQVTAHKKPQGKEVMVAVHMLGNALVGGHQYKANEEYKVPMSVFKAIGTSGVSMARWKIIKEKSGLGSLHK